MALYKESGFTITEVMIAVMVLTIGLLGVAAMQLKAINDNYRASALTEKTSVAEQWMEWLINFSRQSYKLGSEDYIGYERLAALDTNPAVGSFTKLSFACDDTEELRMALKGLGLRPATGEFFAEDQLPKPSAKRYRVTWYIDAHAPLENTTTVKIETTEGKSPSSLIFMVSRSR
jgi:prepilin-type N-terminal cleavage/methylation domain-containing protein